MIKVYVISPIAAIPWNSFIFSKNNDRCMSGVAISTVTATITAIVIVIAIVIALLLQ